ncbi:MAG: DegT/DnrJ/EryC1/StrS family aminotransferase [Planctomycetota bacterium]
MSDITVPLLDLKAQYASLRDEIEPVVRKVIEDQWFIMGPEVAGLEEEVAAYSGTKHAIGVASGSEAILIALQAMNIGCGGGHNGRIICPSYTFFATAGSIWRLGSIPVMCDIDPATYNATPDHVREVLKQVPEGKLAGLMPVHLFGQTVDMDAWLALGEELGVPVIEDAAQAIGAKDATGAMAGSRGKVGCFSFFPSKNLGGFGDGGMITTNDDELAARIKRLRNHGMEPKYYHDEVGLNGRLDALQAAVLRVKLRHLESWHDDRRSNAADYDKRFADAGAAPSTVSLDDDSGLALRTPAPATEGQSRHIYNQYVIRVPGELRDALREHLKAKNIGHDVYYPIPLHLQECFTPLGGKTGDLPHSERAAKETIALPVYPELTETQRAYVVESIVGFLREHAATASGTNAGAAG